MVEKIAYSRGQHPNSRKNLNPRKYVFNYDYFKVVGYEQGYYAGFLAADGNIAQNKSLITLSVQRGDEKILWDMKRAMSAENPIRRTVVKGVYPQSVMTLSHPETCRDLERVYGITPAKSLTLEPPKDLPLDVRDGFVKGLLDGDGCIYIRGKNELCVVLVGTQKITTWVSHEWSRVTGLHIPAPYKVRDKELFVLEVSNAKARAVFQYYDQLPLGLERKWSVDKRNLCYNWRWMSGKYLNKVPLYEDIRSRLERGETVAEISESRNCTVQNIYLTIKTAGYRHYLSVYEYETKLLDKGEEGLS